MRVSHKSHERTDAKGRLRQRLLAMVLATGISVTPALARAEVDEEAGKMLRAMTSYLSGLSTFTFDYDADHEIIDQKGQKLQYSASGSVSVARPDMLRVTRKGPFADIEVTLNGNNISLYGRGMNVFMQLESPEANIDSALQEFRMATGLDAAGADLLASDPYTVLTEMIEEGEHIGTAFVSGVECDHLAFRTAVVDWQIWIRKGAQPLPVKYVITTKWVTAAPQYSVRITNWDVEPKIDKSKFEFSPPSGARRIEQIGSDLIGDAILEEME